MHISGVSPLFSFEDVYTANARTFAGCWLDWWLCCAGSLTSEGAFVCTPQPPSTNQLALAGKEGRPCCTELLPRCLRFPTLSDQSNTVLENPFIAAPLYSFISHSHTTRSPQVSCLISQTMQIQLGQLSLEISSWFEMWGWEFFLVTLSKCCSF